MFGNIITICNVLKQRHSFLGHIPFKNGDSFVSFHFPLVGELAFSSPKALNHSCGPLVRNKWFLQAPSSPHHMAEEVAAEEVAVPLSHCRNSHSRMPHTAPQRQCFLLLTFYAIAHGNIKILFHQDQCKENHRLRLQQAKESIKYFHQHHSIQMVSD